MASRWNLLFGAAVLGAFALAVALQPERQAGPCRVVQSSVSLPDIPEASGLALSRRHPGIVWTHNDSGHAAILFALDMTGTLRGRIRIPIDTRDWEAIAAGPCAAGDCLYIGDIGDNRLARARIRIFRVPEPALDAGETAAPDLIEATYPDGPHNAEAMVLLGGEIFVIPRERQPSIYRGTLPPHAGAIALRRAGRVDIGPVTDANASPDQSLIAVRTAKLVAFYRAADLLNGGTVREHRRISIEGLQEPQGEGVALGAGGALYLATEGRAWTRGGRFTSLQCEI